MPDVNVTRICIESAREALNAFVNRHLSSDAFVDQLGLRTADQTHDQARATFQQGMLCELSNHMIRVQHAGDVSTIQAQAIQARKDSILENKTDAIRAMALNTILTAFLDKHADMLGGSNRNREGEDFSTKYARAIQAGIEAVRKYAHTLPLARLAADSFTATYINEGQEFICEKQIPASMSIALNTVAYTGNTAAFNRKLRQEEGLVKTAYTKGHVPSIQREAYCVGGRAFLDALGLDRDHGMKQKGGKTH